eukprot:scaffold106080_cov19-Prasinocladus_malaysianus.AAC.1
MAWKVAFEDLGGAAGKRVPLPPGYDPACSYEEVPSHTYLQYSYSYYLSGFSPQNPSSHKTL